MAKIRSDYEKSLFARFLNWLTDGSDRLDADMAHALDDQANQTADAIRVLHKLKAEGLLTEEEFQAKKAELLKRL